ncbi:MAG: LysM peptidoglycan-binding domain-containing protein [Anaerolineales bacterium]|nr:LysM peptidoglycan-binding domain-containing protein [Anaerolineales bacterium]MBP6208139.1 LysM peptidoglycan-binding domain-containing protein [Anaerolineales bacterium]
MNNRPPISSSPSSSINAYRKRRQRGGPNIILIIAGLLVLGGIILLIAWLAGPSKPINALFATETPTPTLTFTPTSTSTPTATATVTETPTITVTPTFSTSFNYTVQDGDYLALIVEKYNLGDDGVAWILLLNPYGGVSDSGLPIGVDPATQNIIPGQVLLLPAPGAPLPTSTPIPLDIAAGTKLEYIVQSGDTLAGIASLYNSTEEAIIEENSIADPSKIFVGQLLIIPVNIVTATPTRPPTSTPITPGPGTQLPTVTITPVN